MQNTKEVILLKSLKLFALKGYDAVSVRDIAKEINMTQAALYKHYKSKQDIFDCIVKRMEENHHKKHAELMVPKGSSLEMAKKYKEINLDKIKFISKELFTYWTEDEYASCFRRMITLEQYKNKEMSLLYEKYFLSDVINYMAKLFEEMINVGIFHKGDGYQLSLEFYSPIYLLMSLYDVSENKEEIVKILINHIDDFSRKNEEMIR